MTETTIATVLGRDERGLVAEWVEGLGDRVSLDPQIVTPAEARAQSAELLTLIREAIEAGGVGSIRSAGWSAVRELLAAMSRTRALQGFSPSETAAFVFALKQPLLRRLAAVHSDPAELEADFWRVTRLLDDLGLYTTEVHQQSREDVIARQRDELVEVSTPVIKLWDGVLALPLIGTLDSARTQVVLETLLQRIVDTGSRTAIIDITGVATVDTLVAQHLLKAVAAARLMGAECIISGIRPQIAQTIVHLGISLEDVPTKATMADAVETALARTGFAVVPTPARGDD